MTNSCSARPTCGNVTSFGEFQQALIFWHPRDRQAGARKRYPRTGAVRSHWLVGCDGDHIVHAWRDRIARAEGFGVNVISGYAPTFESRGKVVQEGARAADIKIRSPRYAQVF